MASPSMNYPSGSAGESHQQLWLCSKEQIPRSFLILRIQQVPSTTCDRINTGLITQRPDSKESPLPCSGCHLGDEKSSTTSNVEHLLSFFYLPEQFLRAFKGFGCSMFNRVLFALSSSDSACSLSRFGPSISTNLCCSGGSSKSSTSPSLALLVPPEWPTLCAFPEELDDRSPCTTSLPPISIDGTRSLCPLLGASLAIRTFFPDFFNFLCDVSVDPTVGLLQLIEGLDT